jgi:hypothetical protein
MRDDDERPRIPDKRPVVLRDAYELHAASTEPPDAMNKTHARVSANAE